MGVDFYLACGDCKEVIDLHKWQVVEEAGRVLVHAHDKRGEYPDGLGAGDSPYPFRDLDSQCKKVLVTADDIEEALRDSVPEEPYIGELSPIVGELARRHRGHDLFMTCDMGDPEEDPWWPGRAGFDEWKEIPGAFRSHRYLPRSMLEVDGIRSWGDAVERLREEWPFAYGESCAAEIEAIRTAFERRLRIRSDGGAG